MLWASARQSTAGERGQQRRRDVLLWALRQWAGSPLPLPLPLHALLPATPCGLPASSTGPWSHCRHRKVLCSAGASSSFPSVVWSPGLPAGALWGTCHGYTTRVRAQQERRPRAAPRGQGRDGRGQARALEKQDTGEDPFSNPQLCSS